MTEEVLQPEAEAVGDGEAVLAAEEAETADIPADKGKHRGKAAVELAALREELAQVKDAYSRALAEYANYKRRTDQEKTQLGAFTTAELLKALLPTLDNLERAGAADAPEGDPAALFAAYRAGVEMAFAALQKELAQWGLEAVDPLGEPFDPEAHHAVAREDAGEGEDADVVTAVLQKGYRAGERILRPAMVRVRS